MFRYIFIFFVAYMLGSISVAVIFTKMKFGHDVREEGSGNAGATNVARVFGLSAGLVTLFGDMAKTALSGLAGYLLAGENGLAVACAGCLVGHCWPCYFEYKGGKGVSVSGCIALLLDWRFFIVLLAWFVLMFIISKRVSLCSVTAAVIFPIAYYILNPAFNAAFFVCCFVAVIVIYLHRGNIKRLIKGEESKFRPKSKS